VTDLPNVTDRLTRAADLIDQRTMLTTDGPWRAEERCIWSDSPNAGEAVVSEGTEGDGGCGTPADAEFIATCDPHVVAALVPALQEAARWVKADEYRAPQDRVADNPVVQHLATFAARVLGEEADLDPGGKR
jgi:hypothetical protein